MVHASALNWKLFEAKLVIQGFPKIDPSGSAARIVLEQNKFSETVTSTTDWTWDPRILVALLLQSHAFPTVLIPTAWKTETITKSTEVQKSIDTQTKVELNISQLTLAKIAQLGMHETVTE